MAVDGSGNVFVADDGLAVKEILAVNGSIPANPTIKSSAAASPILQAWRWTGAETSLSPIPSNDAVKEILAVNGSIPANPTINTLGSGFSLPWRGGGRERQRLRRR